VDGLIVSDDRPPTEATPQAAGPSDLVDRALRIARIAQEVGLRLKFLGGMGCWLHVRDHPDDGLVAYRRSYHDLDVVVHKDDDKRVGDVFTRAGYEPARQFNAVQGETRLMYLDPLAGLQVDVFLGEFRMCHTVPLASALNASGHPSLSLAELILTKLQVVELTAKDMNDVGSLLASHPLGSGVEEIDGERLARYLGSDWGLWRTVTENISRLREWSPGAPAGGDRIAAMVDFLTSLIEAAPRSLKWKARARIGDRMIWYEVPEEPQTEWTAVR
jgi:hypothetical protein